MEKSKKAAEIRAAEFDERMKAFDKKMDRMSSEICGIGRSNGAMAEESIFYVLERDMTFCGIKFDEIKRNVVIANELNTLTDLDVVMVNGETIAIIEIKYKVDKDDVIELLSEKLVYFRQYFPKFNNHKVVLGVGGMSFENPALKMAKKNGIGIIKIIGDKIEFNTNNIKIY
jgi:hypothetical protein